MLKTVMSIAEDRYEEKQGATCSIVEGDDATIQGLLRDNVGA